MKNENATAPAIHRFTLTPKPLVKIKMPVGAVIMDTQPGSSGLSVWAMVDPEAKSESRFFAIVPTGQPIPNGWDMVHLKTVVTNNGALHLFEVPAHVAKSMKKPD